MKKTVILILLAFSSLAFAGVLPLDEKNIVNGKVVQDDKVYNIVYYTETYLSNSSILKRIVVEDETEIKVLENDTAALLAKVDEHRQNLTELYANASEVKELKQNVAAAMELIDEKNKLVKVDLEQLQTKKNSIDSVITGNVVISPVTFRASLIVFVLLLILVISANTKGFFSRGKEEHEKTPYEDEE